MAVTPLSGTKSSRDALVSQLIGEWVASAPAARGRWAEATEIANLCLICNNQIEAVKQYASLLSLSKDALGGMVQQHNKEPCGPLLPRFAENLRNFHHNLAHF